MIDVQTVNPLHLPSVPVPDRQRLPRCAGVYFVIHGDGKEILYVGESACIVSRLQNHEKWAEFQRLGAEKIAWLVVEDARERIETEQVFIYRYAPRLNRYGRQFVSEEKRQVLSVRLPVSMYDAITQAARQQGHSLTQEIIFAVQEHLDRLAGESRVDEFSESP